MGPASPSPNGHSPRQANEVLRFGSYEVDIRAGELRKDGIRIKLHGQPFDVLTLLLQRPGEVVTREELQQKLWASDTFVDFEHGLNKAINRVREALGDNADNPRFIETLPRRGYRFLAPVNGPCAPVREPRQQIPVLQTPAATPPKRFYGKVVGAGLAIVTLLAALLAAFNVGHWRDRLLGRTNAPRIESLAVLPLANLSGDPQQDYFADGMTEELITTLGKLGALRVISRTSVMRYKNTDKPLAQIANELNVDAVVEGSAQREGNRVRITAQLIQASTDRHLWAETYDRDLRDILAVESEVAQAIANEVRIKLTPQEETHLANARQVNPAAYELYLKGRYEWNKRTEAGLKRGLEYFQHAVDVDPTYALAFSGLADSYGILGNNGFEPGREVYPKAKVAASRAVELDGSSAEAHTSLGMLLFEYDRNPEAALREYETAIRLNPNYATAHHWYAVILAKMGRAEQAIREIEQARRLDPLSPRINANVALVLYFARQYDRAIVEARKALELEPNNVAAHNYLGLIYVQKVMPREAIAEFQMASSLDPTYSVFAAHLAFAYSAAGDKEQALRILSNLKQRSKKEYVSSYNMGAAYARLGEKEEAFAWLQKGADDYDGWMNFLNSDPMLDPLRSDPRFQELLRRMNFLP